MHTQYGWSGKILFIDLTRRTHRVAETEPYLAFLGGRGINQQLLFESADKDIDAMDPQNPLILGAGPMVGTPVPGANRLAVDYKNVITGGIGSGNCGGRFATEMKHAGYDHIVIKGQASHWCYLLIKDDRIVFRDARDFIGLGTWDLDAAIKSREEDEALSILGIGPAGERRVVFAAMISDRGRAVGYGGSGAVMGSKRLKAVAVTGTRTVQVARPDALARRLKGFEANVLQKSDLVKTYEAGGTLGAYLIPGENRPHGVRNLNESFWGNEALKRVSRDRFDAFLIRRQSCTNCPVHCSGIFKVDDLACEGIQANSLRAFGTNVDVSCARDILYAHALCNTLGLDVDQTSAVIAWAIDCFEQGIIDARDTDGMELKFGDGRCVAAMIRKIANREGFGDLLADGLFGASRKLGRNSEKLAALVKKNGVMEAAMRTHRAWALGIVTSTRGTGHLRGAPGLEFQKLPPEVSRRLFGIDDISDPTAYENKAALVVWQEKYKAVIDMMGLCALVTMWMDRTLFTPEDISAFYEDITGRRTSPSELLQAGDRVQNLERSFNLLHAGFGRSDDMPPLKFVDIPVNKGIYAGEKIDLAGWNRMLDDYYRLHGWDVSTGWPTKKCLSDLGLDEVAERLRQNGVDLT